MKLNRLNILQNFKIENYSDYPYPFFEIENALPEEVYTALKNVISGFPIKYKSSSPFAIN